MNRSKVGSVTVSALGIANTNVGAFYAAGKVPVRLVVLNVGATQIQIAFDSSAVNGAAAATSSSARFELPAGRDFTFVLAPGQEIFAVGVGVGRLTFAASDALPADIDIVRA